MQVVAEGYFKHPDRASKLYLWDVLQAHWVMGFFVKENFTGNPKFHTQAVMFILETMVPRVELEGVSDACANVSDLPLNVRNIASSVDAFDSRLHALEATSGLEVKVGWICLEMQGGIKTGGAMIIVVTGMLEDLYLIFLEEVRVRVDVLNVSLVMALYHILLH